MPNRIIKETICTSEKLAQITDFEFRLWIALILLADDYGRGDARAAIIKGRAFPLRDRLANKDIESSLVNLAAVGCVDLYNVDGRPYYQFPNWGQHQRIQQKKSKFPAPPAKNNSMQKVTVIHGDIPPESNPIQSNPNPEPESARSAASAAAARPDFCTVEAYAANNLSRLSPGNMAEFADFKAELPEELIRHAIDEACAAGKPSFGYVRSILMRYLEQGIRTLGDAKADEARRKAEKQPVEKPGGDFKWFQQ